MRNNTFLTSDRDNKIYSLQERQRAILYSTEFIASVDCVIASVARQSGTFANFRTNLPYAVRGVYAASLKSISMPTTFNNLYVRTFTVSYGMTGSWPGNFTLPQGYFQYPLNAGTVTYATATGFPTSNNLLYYILNYFMGALDSLHVDPTTGAINWTWDSATGGVTSTNVPAFFNLLSTSGLSWISNGNPVDLAAPKQIGIIIPDIASQNSKSNVTGIPNYFCVVPNSAGGGGSVLNYEPEREDL